MDGQNCEPDGMEFFQRLTRKMIMRILDDKSFDIFSLEPILLAQLEDFCGKNQISDEAFKIEIPRILFKTCEEDGLHWIAGRDCSKNIQSSDCGSLFFITLLNHFLKRCDTLQKKFCPIVNH